MLYTCIVTQMSKRSGDGPDHRQSGLGIDEVLRTRFFKALCDPSRAGLLVRLAQACEPQSVSQIAGCCPCDMSVVSRHLAMLRDAGILDAVRRGKQVYYSVRYNEIVSTLRAMADALEACCGTIGPCEQGSDPKKRGERR